MGSVVPVEGRGPVSPDPVTVEDGSIGTRTHPLVVSPVLFYGGCHKSGPPLPPVFDPFRNDSMHHRLLSTIYDAWIINGPRVCIL